MHKTFFLRSLIVALSISALIGIFIFLVGDFGDTEARILATTLSIGGFSLTGLCSANLKTSSRYEMFSNIGMIVSVLGFIFTLITIWEFAITDHDWKAMLTFIILAVAMAHVALLLLIKPKTNLIRILLIATMTCISIVAFMLIKSTWSEFKEAEFYFRVLGVFAILDVLGTIVTPIMNRIAESDYGVGNSS